MRTAVLFIGLVAVLLGGFLLVAMSGIYDVAATTPHSALVRWVLSTTMERSVASRARDIEVPDLGDTDLRLAGLNDYSNMCAGCHTPPGQDKSAIARGLNPAPPDLAQSARTRSAAELFWVTKYGIKMTGMPAWGPTHSDEDIWRVVAFLQALPDLDPAAYSQMLERARGKGGHHDDDAASDISEVPGETTDEHDHAAHPH